jgi:hypothetical protein
MHVKPAPAALHRVKMVAVKRDARADYLHVFVAVLGKTLAWTERDPMLLLKQHFLLEEKINELLIRAEFITERLYYPLEKKS